MTPPLRALVLYAASDENATLSYQTGWPRHLARHPAFDARLVNVAAPSLRDRAELRVSPWRSRYDAVVVLHSVFSNAYHLSQEMLERIAAIDAAKAYLIGNEYKLLPEKMAFCDALGIDLLVTMNHDSAAQAFYRERIGCAVVAIPSAGLDPEVFRAQTPWEQRPIDIGYRAYDAPWYLGHRERTEIAERVLEAAERRGLATDISLDPQARLREPEWAAFLNACKGQIGTEAGGDFFELTDATRLEVNAFLDAHPEASFEEVRARFFSEPRDDPPGRAISGRQVEAAATRTPQILLEGAYSGYFEAGVHYIPLRKDYSNLDEALEMLCDPGTSLPIADAAYEVAHTELTYDRLLERLSEALRALPA